jgi:uncharacterized protein
MELPHEATLLRIFVGERDRHGHQPLYEAIVSLARKHGLAGATVLRGLAGYGCSTVIHTAKLVELSDDLPMVVEIVDTEDKIQDFLEVLNGKMQSGLVTLERVRVLQYGMPKKK